MAQSKDELYKNWQFAVLGLKYLKQGLETFVKNETQNCHFDLIQDLKKKGFTSTIDTSAQTYMDPIDYRIPPVYYCSKDDTGDVKQCSKQCHNAVCRSLVIKIQNHYRQGNPIWKNTDPCMWASDYWEVAKCFLSIDGYKDKHSVEDTDCSGLLSIIINMKPILNKPGRSDLDINTIVDCFKQVGIFHASSQFCK